MADKHLTPDDILDRMELSETGKELRKLKCPLRVAYGGINAGKTHFILQDIVAQCLGFQPEPDRINGRPNQLRVIIGAYDFSHVDTNILLMLKKVMYKAGCPWDVLATPSICILFLIKTKSNYLFFHLSKVIDKI